MADSSSTPSTSPVQMYTPSPKPSSSCYQAASSTSPAPVEAQSSTTPPPRPASSQGVSVIAPRPLRLPLLRPHFTRPPVSMYEFGSSDKDRVGSPGAAVVAGSAGYTDRRSSSASNTGFHQEDAENAGESRGMIYSPTRDALEELYKIMHKRSTSSASNTTTTPSIPNFVKPKVLQQRSPNMRHRRDASDASDSNLSLLSKTPDMDWRPSPVSPVARHYNRNPMIRDPSFNNNNNNDPSQSIQP